MQQMVAVERPRPRLSAADLRRDHERVKSLLERFAHMGCGMRQHGTLRVALDLFEVHSALEDQFYATDVTHDAYAEVAGLMQRLGETDSASRLYVVRGLELKRALIQYMVAEEEAAPKLVREELHLAQYTLNLLHSRRRLVEEAQRLLRVH